MKMICVHFSMGRVGTWSCLIARALVLVLALQHRGGLGVEVQIGVILPRNNSRMFSIDHVSPAISIAIEKLHSSDDFQHINFFVNYNDSNCDSTRGALSAINYYLVKTANIFFGPVCDYALAPVARYAPHWNIPVISPGGLAHDFGNKKGPNGEFPTITRLGGSFEFLADALVAVNLENDWEKVKLIYFSKGFDFIMENFCFHAISGFGSKLKTMHNLKYDEKIAQDHDNISDIIKKEIGRDHAVVVLCASPDSVRDIMIKAAELNFVNGEYVFFNIDLFSSKNATERPWYRENDTRNDIAKKAYQALMTVTLRKPESEAYRNFSEEVKRRAREKGSNITYGKEEVNSFVGAFHDAVILYALALNETLAANGSITDGKEITRRMWNRTFEGITGNVSIDDNGDRNADYSLLDMTDPETGKFEVVANYYGKTKKYEPVASKRIHWPGNRQSPPPDTPVCGYDGSKCPPEKPFPEYAIVIIVLGSVLVIVLVAAFYIYRHIKLEAELAEMSWRVRWEDILFGTRTNKKLERSTSRLSLTRRISMTSSCSGDTIAVHLSDMGSKQLFTRTGYYKGTIVAIKKINRTSITINKPLLLEIKRIKDLQCDYIARFIGSCVDPPNMCVLTEYCPKGSLQDVLENEQIKLDWMFRYSLMQDIVRGMAYLHNSEIRSHGNLKSTNCVIDSRFVLKLTDFGLHLVRGSDTLTEEDTYAYYHKKLWTAPELLRMQHPLSEGTQKSDVYSFAIICQEISYRCGTFYLANMDLSPKEIYQKVMNGLRPYFRPTLEIHDCPSEDLADVIRKCWAEDPMERPDFDALKSIIRRMNKDGDKGNILDNLLSRMEQYANNLEALVEERTADYLEQKKKAEDLLYLMLPKSVAGQLIKGESVMAETYESVTIYFSDICGFTAMSAESTPMQVVDLLNDLYTTFDSIIESFDVYKVETIGDAYMVVSGMPVRNGNIHGREIAGMSIAILKAVLSFKIRHRPNEQLKLRIGIHSGPVCAGVVGLKMPRYCLFGDTVNTASRMESHGFPLKIHVSPQSKAVLDEFGTFELECRGPVEMKGKGKIITYWLLGEKKGPDANTNTNSTMYSNSNTVLI